MPLGSLRQQLLFPTDCPKTRQQAAPGHTHSTDTPTHTKQKQDEQQQQQPPSEATPLLAGSEGAHSSTATAAAAADGSSFAGSSSAVKPSGAVQRGSAHTPRRGETGSSRQATQAVDPLASTSAAAAATPTAAISSSSFVVDIQAHSSNDISSTDQELQQLLCEVRLGHLLQRFPSGLDTEVDWASVLSLGEQQRVALVRLLYHKPLLAFLDEATAALDPKSEAVVYGLIARACRCFVSVGHRLQLLEWHSHVLVSVGGGLWAKYTAAEYKQRLAAGQEG